MKLVASLSLSACLVLAGGATVAENVDPDNDDSQRAYAENVGWINAEPSGNGGPGVQVGDVELSGWMWGENVGWLSLSCQNTLGCASQSFGVTNDGAGNLNGFAYGENVGWISFSCDNSASCGTSNYGVTVDPATGAWSGMAYGENVGWISFSCDNTASCGTTDYRVKTDWACNPLPAVPSGPTTLQFSKDADAVVLSWSSTSGGTGSDIVRGELGSLRSSGGNFATATDACLADDRTSLSLADPATPTPGQGIWYLVRGQNCGGSASYDGGVPPQSGSRDPEIAASGNDCS